MMVQVKPFRKLRKVHNKGKRTRVRDLIRYDMRQMHAAFTGTLPVGASAESLGHTQVCLQQIVNRVANLLTHKTPDSMSSQALIVTVCTCCFPLCPCSPSFRSTSSGLGCTPPLLLVVASWHTPGTTDVMHITCYAHLLGCQQSKAAASTGQLSRATRCCS